MDIPFNHDQTKLFKVMQLYKNTSFKTQFCRKTKFFFIKVKLFYQELLNQTKKIPAVQSNFSANQFQGFLSYDDRTNKQTDRD